MKFRFVLFALLAAMTSCVTSQHPVVVLNRYEFQQPEMGMPFRIVLYAPSVNAAQGASAAAFARVKQLNDIMSDYDSDSELSRLSQTSGQDQAVKVSPDLWTVLERSQQLAEASHGAFDVTVGPVVNLWRYSRRIGKLPDPAKLEKARQAVGYTKMQLDPATHAVKLLVPNMRLDLGGIAKGYAVAQALVVLSRCGVTNALVAAGGDMAVSGAPPGKKGWRIELPSLDVTNAPPSKFLTVTHAGISTSGDLFQRLEVNGTRYSHIIDPRTGQALTDHSLVTVIAPDDFTADGLTKIASILPPKEAMKLISKTPGVDVRIVRQPANKLEIYQSPGFRQYYE